MTLIVFQCNECDAITNAHEDADGLAPPRGNCPVCGASQHIGWNEGFKYVRFEKDETKQAQELLGQDIAFAPKGGGYIWYFPAG